jgi:hypothetical protein
MERRGVAPEIINPKIKIPALWEFDGFVGN